MAQSAQAVRNHEQWSRAMATQLDDLSSFVAVVRAGGFRDAARIAGQSPSGLSEAIRRLETRLGVRLLHRTTRSVAPTEAGARLFERLTPALAEVHAALDVVNTFRDTPAGTLRLNVPAHVARTVLPAIAVPFLRAFPDISMEVTVEDGFVDILASGADAGIRYEERLEQDMIAMPIGPRRQRIITAAAPAYLATHGRPQHPRDLLAHACLRGRFSGGAMALWEFEKDGEILRLDPPARSPSSPALPATWRSRRRSRALASSISSRTGCAPIWTAARWSPSCRAGAKAFPARCSIIQAAVTCLRPYAPSSISCAIPHPQPKGAKPWKP
jgi:DNA-binding transcriptional LysR family regulator